TNCLTLHPEKPTLECSALWGASCPRQEGIVPHPAGSPLNSTFFRPDRADTRRTEGRCLVSTLDNFRREARRWLNAIRAGDAEAIRRLHRAHARAPELPALRDV